MASVHRDPRSPQGVWYCALTTADGRRVLRSTGKRNRREAMIICQMLQEAEDQASTGELTRARLETLLNETLRRLGLEELERVTVRAWLEDWLASKTQVSPATRRCYKQAVSEFLEYLGPLRTDRPLESITEADIRGFVTLLRSQGCSASTINRLVRKSLSIPFEKARKLGKLKFNPIATIDPEKGETATRDTFTPQQVARLVVVADRDWAGAILIAYGCGGRLLDIANLKWSGLDLQHEIVSFRERKTGRAAIIGLHPDFIDWIAQRSVPDDPDSYVFPSLANRSSAGTNGLSKAFEAIMERAGVKSRLIRERNGGRSRSLRALSFHSFRHSAASAVFNQAALKEITRRVTNHAGSVVDKYIHQDLEAIRGAVALVPRLPK